MIYSIKMSRGDTFKSDFFTMYNESLPEFITEEETAQGVADGIYTIIDPSTLNLRGQVRTSHDGLKMFDLQFETTATKFHFVIPSEHTSTITNTIQTLIYDIEALDENETSTICKGDIIVMPDVTTNNIL
jgi:hypothetical protein